MDMQTPIHKSQMGSGCWVGGEGVPKVLCLGLGESGASGSSGAGGIVTTTLASSTCRGWTHSDGRLCYAVLCYASLGMHNLT